MKKAFIILFFFLFAHDAYSASCAITNQNNRLIIDTTTPIQNCTGFVVIDSSDYQELTTNQDFDSEVYDMVINSIIQFFITGFTIGLIIKIISKLKQGTK